MKSNGTDLSLRASIITLGCPKNEVDSEVLSGELTAHGVEIVDDEEYADILYVNTCGFIEAAKRESIGAILQAVKWKQRRTGRRVVVWGCLSQRYRELKELIPEIDGCFGVEPFEIMIRNTAFSGYRWTEAAWNRRYPCSPGHTAYVKIADGCSHSCAFCAIPMIKGPYRSRPMESVVTEVRHLAARGVKEIILIAQDTGAYGMDRKEKQGLYRLLRGLVRVPGLCWIRMMYLHPAHLSENIISMMEGEPKICRYVDMPLQHIDETLLRAMRRPVSRDKIVQLIERLRTIPQMVLRTAFIVGFPGETEFRFRTLMDFIRENRFDRLGAFVFSAEEGTEAFAMSGKVRPVTAAARYRQLMALQQKISRELNEARIGETVDVLIDEYDAFSRRSAGRTSGDAPEIDQTVWVNGFHEPGRIIPVTLTAGFEYDLEGSPAVKLKMDIGR
ncbi:MAG TPA: 30S ribosomal protein S12 methylthiotransferase RimO [bacterium]|nr:30S ribosomal protein S12 methylthiotransferase RimO [bacterium]